MWSACDMNIPFEVSNMHSKKIHNVNTDFQNEALCTYNERYNLQT